MKQTQRDYQILFIITFSASLGLSIVNPFFPIYVKNIGLNGLSIALIFSGYSLSRILFMPLLGRWSDLTNRKHFIITGLGTYCIVSLCYLFLPDNALYLIFLRLIQGMAAALVRPIAQAFVGDTTTKGQEGSLMGAFDVSFYAALAVGPIIGGFIQDIFNFKGIFLIWFILCLLSLVMGILGVTDQKGPSEASEKVISGPNNFYKARILQGILCYIFARSFGIVLIAIFLPMHMHFDLNLSSVQIGTIMSSGSILIPVLLRPMGKLSDRVNRRFLVIIGGSLSAISILFVPFAVGFWHLIILTVCIGFFSVLSLPASSALVVEEGKRLGMGLTMGLFNSVLNAGFILAPFLGGFLMDTAGSCYIFYVAGGIGLLGVYLFSVLCPSVEIEKLIVFENYAK